jgi:hypothetical protein
MITLTQTEEHILAILEAHLATGESILTTYGDVCKKCNKIYGTTLHPYNKWFHQNLGNISNWTLQERDFALSSIVISKDTLLPSAFNPYHPSASFADNLKTWAQQITKIIDYYMP